MIILLLSAAALLLPVSVDVSGYSLYWVWWCHQLEFYVCWFYEVKLTTSCSVAANLVLLCQMTSAGACPQTLWAYNCSKFVHSLSVLEGAMCLFPIRYNYVLNKGTSDVTTYETKLFALTQSYYFLFQGHYNQNHQHCPNMQFFFHVISSLSTFTFFSDK